MTTLIGGGTGPAEGTQATTCTPGPGTWPMMHRALDALAGQRAAARQGQHRLAPKRSTSSSRPARAASSCTRTGDRRRRRSTPACAPRERGGVQVAHPHRHAQRGRLPRVDARGDRRPPDPRVPHRGRRRRSRAGHHRDRRAAQRAALIDQPDAAAHAQHRRRAPRHADGLPPPQPANARGPRVRRVPHPRRARSPPRTCSTTSARSR